MRRAEKEITNVSEILDVMGNCGGVCRIGLSHNNMPYIVPMCFGCEYAEDRLTLYFHCAKEGMKLDILAQNPLACFELDYSTLIEAKSACGYSMTYASVIGQGRITVCTDAAEKNKGLKLIMRTYVPHGEFEFNDAQLRSVTVLRMDVDSFTGKRSLD